MKAGHILTRIQKITLVTSFSKGVYEGCILLAQYVSDLSSGYKGKQELHQRQIYFTFP